MFNFLMLFLQKLQFCTSTESFVLGRKLGCFVEYYHNHEPNRNATFHSRHEFPLDSLPGQSIPLRETDPLTLFRGTSDIELRPWVHKCPPGSLQTSVRDSPSHAQLPSSQKVVHSARDTSQKSPSPSAVSCSFPFLLLPSSVWFTQSTTHRVPRLELLSLPRNGLSFAVPSSHRR
jgi:hypothetical protein